MSKFHIKENGEPGRCTAKPGNCPFGADAPHFSTKQEARTHFEHLQKVAGAGFAAIAGFPSTMVPQFDRDAVPLLNENSTNDPVGVLKFTEMQDSESWELQYSSNYEDFSETRNYNLGVEITTEVFDDRGELLHTEEAYTTVWLRDESAVRETLVKELGEGHGGVLATGEPLEVHTWESPNRRVTVEACFSGLED